MGLDVTAYKNVKHAPTAERDGDDLLGDTVCLYKNPDFPSQYDDLIDDAPYSYEDSFGFAAGGYGGYNRWRNDLAKIAGHQLGTYEQFGKPWPSYCASVWDNPDRPGPFVELINFSDCEGTIGPKTCAKLAKDFAEHQAKADEHPDPWFREKYAAWRRAFEMAAAAGAVRFH